MGVGAMLALSYVFAQDHLAIIGDVFFRFRFHILILALSFFYFAPVVYQVILEPGIGQFSEFESPRVHTRINS